MLFIRLILKGIYLIFLLCSVMCTYVPSFVRTQKHKYKKKITEKFTLIWPVRGKNFVDKEFTCYDIFTPNTRTVFNKTGK